ncbi:HlyD family secretion protein [Scytonema sp. NUACC26]|uniref:HlyD family secretion protein n=1 Tax=Scytonema sp. NUACC26 TaxID=3140176 RepID=UPI0034DC2261
MTRSQTPLNEYQNGRGPATLNNESFTDSDSGYQSNGAGKQPTTIQLPQTTEPERTDTNGQKPPSPRGKMPERRKRLILVALGVGAIVAGIFGFRWWQYASSHEQTDDAAVSGHIHPVSSRVNGTVATVLVEENQQVQQGQVLVKLDPRDYQNQVQQAQAALNQALQKANTAKSQITLSTQTTRGTTTQAQGNVSSASAAITNAQAGVQEAQAGVPAAQAQVAQAQANLQRAQADFNRYNRLYQQGAISAQQFESARNAYQVALAQENSAQDQVRQAQARVVQAQQDVARTQAQLTASQGGLQQAQAGQVQTQVNRNQYQATLAAVTQAQANLNNAQLQLSYTTITAPITGTAGNKNVEVGQRVQPGTPLMAVVDGKNWVVANFKETQLEDMHPGDSAEIRLDAFPHHPFRGHVESLSPASGSQFALLPPDNATGNFTKVVQRIPVRVVFDPQSIRGYESRITPGISAVVSVDVK